MKVPILKLKDILLTSIQVDLTDEDALNFQDDLMQEITRTESVGILIDITALDVVDSYFSKVLNDTAIMAGLLGCEVVITGMQPSVALTLVEMGRELVNVETALNLDQGMEKLQEIITANETETKGGED